MYIDNMPQKGYHACDKWKKGEITMNDTPRSRVFHGPLADFPESGERPDGVKPLAFEDGFGYVVDMMPNVLYDRRGGEDLHVQLLRPVNPGADSTMKFPLIVFVQGSAWRRQRIFAHLQHLVRVCEHGYVVAIVQYRSSDTAPFPAQIEDVKTAVRFLRKNYREYGIDPERAAIWGDSSGGHTAVMAGITKDGELDGDPGSRQYGEFSAGIKCIVDWYGPTDISRMGDFPSMMDHYSPDSPEGMLIGGKDVLENPELAAPTVPMRYLSAEKPIPPILIMHGTRDQLVAFNQSCILYNELKDLKKDVEMYALKGAYHGFGGFNCNEALDIVLKFFGRHV
jgi:acetyl esterase/lipase